MHNYKQPSPSICSSIISAGDATYEARRALDGVGTRDRGLSDLVGDSLILVGESLLFVGDLDCPGAG